MKTIYMHIPRNGNKRFDKELFPKEVPSPLSHTHAFLNKPDIGLWGSPFNTEDRNTWEMYYYGNYLSCKDVYQGEGRRMREANDSHYYDQLEKTFKIGWNQYIQMPESELQKYRAQMTMPYSEKEIRIATMKDESRRLEDIKNIRRDAFFFTVDDSKVLHIKTLDDIEPYVVEKDPAPLMTKFSIDFEKIKEDGYHGLDLTMCADFKCLFYAWDVSSIVMWDISTVEEVSPELARISRISYSPRNLIDDKDMMMTKDFVLDYMKDNLDALMDAEKKGLCSYDDVYNAIVDSDGKDIGHGDQEQDRGRER